MRSRGPSAFVVTKTDISLIQISANWVPCRIVLNYFGSMKEKILPSPIKVWFSSSISVIMTTSVQKSIAFHPSKKYPRPHFSPKAMCSSCSRNIPTIKTWEILNRINAFGD